MIAGIVRSSSVVGPRKFKPSTQSTWPWPVSHGQISYANEQTQSHPLAATRQQRRAAHQASAIWMAARAPSASTMRPGKVTDSSVRAPLRAEDGSRGSGPVRTRGERLSASADLRNAIEKPNPYNWCRCSWHDRKREIFEKMGRRRPDGHRTVNGCEAAPAARRRRPVPWPTAPTTDRVVFRARRSGR